MADLLFLAHRFPYPPNKGDKIRSYHLLRHLAERHRVRLGCFVDDPDDMRHLGHLQELCEDVLALPIRPSGRRVASLAGIVRGEALSLGYYRDRRMQQWCDRLLAARQVDAAVVFCSAMAQYVDGARWQPVPRVADFVDVDSDKWRQYAERARAPMSWLYAREATRLLEFERRIASQFDATLLVSDAEADLFRRLAPECAPKVGGFSNGVDTAYFDPDFARDAAPALRVDPYGEGGPVAVFTGAMDYWPNVEAVSWFAREILPLVRRLRPDVRFAIVGSNPSKEVRELAGLEGVTVTGRVPDVRPYLAHAQVVVAPLRIARGIQNKVLEALAMARPVVCTDAAAEGIEPRDRLQAAVVDDASGFARAVADRLEAGTITANRAFVLEHYSWSQRLRSFDAALDAAIAAHQAPAAPARTVTPELAT